jgi:hypothetical protein
MKKDTYDEVMEKAKQLAWKKLGDGCRITRHDYKTCIVLNIQPHNTGIMEQYRFEFIQNTQKEGNEMPKLIDYQCPACGAIKEGFEGEKNYCSICARIDVYGILVVMRPIFSPKRNGQRWKHND